MIRQCIQVMNLVLKNIHHILHSIFDCLQINLVILFSQINYFSINYEVESFYSMIINSLTTASLKYRLLSFYFYRFKYLLWVKITYLHKFYNVTQSVPFFLPLRRFAQKSSNILRIYNFLDLKKIWVQFSTYVK